VRDGALIDAEGVPLQDRPQYPEERKSTTPLSARGAKRESSRENKEIHKQIISHEKRIFYYI
jgi:hypothetical protein